MSSKPRKIVSSIAVVLLAMPLLATAEDGKVYPATMCQGTVGNPTNLSYDGTKLVNTSTTYSAVVVCPMIKDDVFSGAGANEAYMRYYKANSTGFISNLYSFSAFGTASFTQFKSDFGGAGYKTLSYTPISSYSQGYYQFVVVIPPGTSTAKSSVISYRLDEN